MINERFQILFPKRRSNGYSVSFDYGNREQVESSDDDYMKGCFGYCKNCRRLSECLLYMKIPWLYSRFCYSSKNFCLKLFCQSRMYRKLQGWISFLLRLNQNIKNVIECVKKIADYIMEKFNYRCTDGGLHLSYVTCCTII